MQLIYETILIGFLTVLIYLIIDKFVECKYRKIFLVGVIIHLFCEFSGINRWYCKNGNACK